jgi:hypothetical protein
MKTKFVVIFLCGLVTGCVAGIGLAEPWWYAPSVHALETDNEQLRKTFDYEFRMLGDHLRNYDHAHYPPHEHKVDAIDARHWRDDHEAWHSNYDNRHK